ncbi:hypothetical protein EVAR_28474_1 [Eumeta japonica]|uniref:Uncharacterized protein n=1 Tax=Eumeta variegata TaxID=151549 RepID=A0A4C1V8I4_EUMVA|nr:hypothetical protein EVAR_28474_1 [Eumeta japonica]
MSELHAAPRRHPPRYDNVQIPVRESTLDFYRCLDLCRELEFSRIFEGVNELANHQRISGHCRSWTHDPIGVTSTLRASRIGIRYQVVGEGSMEERVGHRNSHSIDEMQQRNCHCLFIRFPCECASPHRSLVNCHLHEKGAGVTADILAPACGCTRATLCTAGVNRERYLSIAPILQTTWQRGFSCAFLGSSTVPFLLHFSSGSEECESNREFSLGAREQLSKRYKRKCIETQPRRTTAGRILTGVMVSLSVPGPARRAATQKPRGEYYGIASEWNFCCAVRRFTGLSSVYTTENMVRLVLFASQ